ncbi:MAG: hypothetical protein RJA15_926, partial [Actinomycetota bacterium]
ALVAHGYLLRIARWHPHVATQCFDGGSVDACLEDFGRSIFAGQGLDDVGNYGLTSFGDVLGIGANLDGTTLQGCCHVQQSTTRCAGRTMQ